MRLGNPNIAVDSAAEELGRWVECPSLWWQSDDKPMKVLIRGASTRRHTLLVQRLTRNLKAEEIEERAHEINCSLAADILLNWENHFDNDGKELLYSPQLAKDVLNNADNRRYVEFILLCARTLTTFDPQKREEVEKN